MIVQYFLAPLNNKSSYTVIFIYCTIIIIKFSDLYTINKLLY